MKSLKTIGRNILATSLSGIISLSMALTLVTANDSTSSVPQISEDTTTETSVEQNLTSDERENH